MKEYCMHAQAYCSGWREQIGLKEEARIPKRLSKMVGETVDLLWIQFAGDIGHLGTYI